LLLFTGITHIRSGNEHDSAIVMATGTFVLCSQWIRRSSRTPSTTRPPCLWRPGNSWT